MTTQYDNYTYITSTGVIVPDTSSVQEQVNQDLLNVFGQDLDLTPETPQGRLSQCLTDYRVNTLAINAQNANQINLRYATGRFLDAIAAFFGLKRIQATSTKVLATVTGIAGTVIPSGTQVQTTAGDVFYAENNITIGSNGTATGYFLSLQKGSIQCEVNSLSVIVNAVLGWETVNNSSSAVLGSNQESDTALRIRIEQSRYSGISLLEAIKAKLVNIENVNDSWVYDNFTNSSITYDGITIDPHSIVVVVDGGNNNDIAQALFKVKTGGTGYTAISDQSITVNVTDGAFGVQYPVTFNRPSAEDFEVAITVKNVNYDGSDLEGDVKQAILDWSKGLVEGVDGLKIGQNVSPFEIAAAVSAKVPTIFVSNCQVCLEGGTPAISELTFNHSQIGQITENNITVTVA